LRESRQHIESQDAKATALLRLTRPALDDVPELVEDTEPLLREAAPLVGQVLAVASDFQDVTDRLPALVTGVQGFVNEGLPLARDLRVSDLPSLVADLRSSDLPSLVADLRASELPSLIDSLRDSDLPSTVGSAQELIESLSEGQRLASTLDTTNSLLSQAHALELPQRAVESSKRLRKLLRVQRRTYRIQRQSLEVQR
jgi:hypothetical protein